MIFRGERRNATRIIARAEGRKFRDVWEGAKAVYRPYTIPNNYRPFTQAREMARRVARMVAHG